VAVATSLYSVAMHERPRVPRPLAHSALIALCLCTQACAQSTPAQAVADGRSPLPYVADGPPIPPLPALRDALAAIEQGREPPAPLPLGQPLSGWFEFAALRRDLEALSSEQGQAFLDRYRDQVVAQTFREGWLGVLAKREDWPSFRAAWSPAIKSTALRCAELNARQALGETDARWVSDAQAIWRGAGKALPGDCDAPMAVLAAEWRGLQPALRWDTDREGRRRVAARRHARRRPRPARRRLRAGERLRRLPRIRPTTARCAGRGRRAAA
jgi:soluble lytic murein transglycosylase